MIFGEKMLIFLCFFMGVVRCASTFPVPSNWESTEVCSYNFIGKVASMADPASVGLQKCEVWQDLRDEGLLMQSLKGEKLTCAVNCSVIQNGIWLFSISAEKGGCGGIYFHEQGERRFVDVAAGFNTVATRDLVDFNLCSQAHNIQYDFGEERVTVRKFLGHIDGDDRKELFVSVTIAYNDIETIETGYGTGRLSWSSGPFNGLKQLSPTTTIKTLCLGSTGASSFSNEWDRDSRRPMTACFGSTGTFSVLDEWDCDSRRPMTAKNGNKVLSMKDPASVALQGCEITQGLVEDMIFVQNLDGDRLFLSMNKPVVCPGGWIFSASYNGENLGSVWFLSEGQFRVSLEIRSEGEIKASHHFEARPREDREWCRYNIDQNSLTVRKFFCYGCTEVFVSATIAYDDLKNVLIRCGYGGEDWAFEGAPVGTLSRGFGQMPQEGAE